MTHAPLRRLVPWAAVVTPALLAGGVVALALPPFGFWVLAPLGLGAIALLSDGKSAAHRALVGGAVGIGFFSVSCLWALEFTGAGYGVVVALESLLLALALVLVPRRRGSIAGFVAALTLAEWVRSSWPFGGVPLSDLSLAEASSPLSGLARIDGPLLVTAATLLAGVGLGELALAAYRAPRARRIGRGASAVAVVVVAAALAALAPAGGAPVGAVSVALVQGGGRRGTSSLEVPAGHVFAATDEVARRLRPPVDLVVWPEDTLGLAEPLSRSAMGATVAALARHLHTTLLAGITVPVATTRFRNALVAWGPNGAVIGQVEKAHPVPFGEYVPLRSLIDKIANLSEVPRDVIVGHNDGLLRTPAGPLALVNSFETFFPSRGRSGVRAGGELLVVETNTASYATSEVPSLELAASRLQAVALGRSLVESATVGYSAVVSASGEVLRRSLLGRPALIRATVPLRAGATVYEQLGDLPTVVAAAVALACAWTVELRLGRRVRALRRGRS